VLVVMALCVALVPLLAYFVGGWQAYWGHALIAIVFSILAVLIKTKYYWEEN
jgi:hypothetical protein